MDKPARRNCLPAPAAAPALAPGPGAPRLRAQLARLYTRPGFLLRRAHQIAASVFEHEARDHGLTPAQFGALSVVRLLPGMDQSTLARSLGYDKVTTLRVLRGLEARGLIVRTTAEGSRRNMALRLSMAGQRLLAQGRKAADRAGRRVLSPLSTEEQMQLIALLKKLTDALESQARAPWISPLAAGKPPRSSP